MAVLTMAVGFTYYHGCLLWLYLLWLRLVWLHLPWPYVLWPCLLGDCVKAMGLVDDMGFGLGLRSKRFVVVAEAGVVK